MKIKKNLVLIMSLVMMLSVSACGNNKNSSNAPENTAVADSAEKKEVYISAAASLTDVINELKDDYESEHKDIEIKTNYAGSGALQSQIEEGAPADIFMSAADKQMDALEEKDLIDKDSREELLQNEVVLIIPKDSDLNIESFEDVVKPELENIAIADPASVPVGQYSEEIFTNLNIWDQVKSKMVVSQDVRQSLDWVATGNAKSATVYQTDAYVEKDRVKIVAAAPENSHKAINYPIAIVKNSKDKEEVKDFYDYLKSDDAKKVYEKYGFVVNK